MKNECAIFQPFESSITYAGNLFGSRWLKQIFNWLNAVSPLTYTRVCRSVDRVERRIGLGSLNGSSCQSYSNEMFLGQMRRMGFNENTQIPNNAREMLLKQTVQRSLATLVTLRLCYGSFSFYAISLPHPACNFSALTCK